MAERGAWAGIQRHGLLSTTALLDLFAIKGQRREAIERQHRPSIVKISDKKIGSAAIRDQIPMSDAGLRRALPSAILPADWYQRLNGMVFFWMTEGRLLRLTSACSYREIEHEVIVFDTRAIIEAHFSRIWLCPINSGCTKPMPHPRDYSTFKRIENYDYQYWRSRRGQGERVVELCIDYSVTDVKSFVIDGFVIRGEEKLGPLF